MALSDSTRAKQFGAFRKQRYFLGYLENYCLLCPFYSTVIEQKVAKSAIKLKKSPLLLKKELFHKGNLWCPKE